MNAKDHIGEAIIFKQLVAKIRDLEEEIEAKDSEIKAFSQTIQISGDNASRDMQYIYQLEAEVKKLKKEIKGIEKRHDKVKRRIYDDFKAD